MYLVQTKKPIHKIIVTSILAFSITIASVSLIMILEADKYLGRIYANSVVYLLSSFFLSLLILKSWKFRKSIFLQDTIYSLKLSSPIIVHLVMNQLLVVFSRIFIIQYHSEFDYAIFSVAYGIGIIGMIIADALNNAWSPLYFENTKSGNNTIINELSKYYILIVSIMFAGLSLLSRELFIIMAPVSYHEGIKIVPLIIFAVYFTYLYRFPLSYEQYRKNMKWVSLATLVSAVISFFLSSYFIPNLGILGAAYTLLGSYISLFIIHEFIARVIIGNFNIKILNYIPGITIVCVTSFLTIRMQDLFFIRIILSFILGLSGLIIIKKVMSIKT